VFRGVPNGRAERFFLIVPLGATRSCGRKTRGPANPLERMKEISLEKIVPQVWKTSFVKGIKSNMPTEVKQIPNPNRLAGSVIAVSPLGRHFFRKF